MERAHVAVVNGFSHVSNGKWFGVCSVEGEMNDAGIQIAYASRVWTVGEASLTWARLLLIPRIRQVGSKLKLGSDLILSLSREYSSRVVIVYLVSLMTLTDRTLEINSRTFLGSPWTRKISMQ